MKIKEYPERIFKEDDDWIYCRGGCGSVTEKGKYCPKCNYYNGF